MMPLMAILGFISTLFMGAVAIYALFAGQTAVSLIAGIPAALLFCSFFTNDNRTGCR